jgi:hypothetical protein
MTLHLYIPQKPKMIEMDMIFCCSVCRGDGSLGIWPCHPATGGERGEKTIWLCSNPDCCQEYD